MCVKYNGGVGDDHANAPLKYNGEYLGRMAALEGIRIDFLRLRPFTDTMIQMLKEEFAVSGGALLVEHRDTVDLVAKITESLVETSSSTQKQAAHAKSDAGTATRKAIDVSPIDSIAGANSFPTSLGCASIYTLNPETVVARAGNPIAALLASDPRVHMEKRQLSLMAHPFAKGEMRLAYYASLEPSSKGIFRSWRHPDHPETWVAKTSICEDAKTELGATQAKMQNVARFLAEEFNANVSRKAPALYKVKYAPVQLARGEGSQETWMLEPPLTGKYVKFNNNTGYINVPLQKAHPALQAFSHFTYEYSDRMLLVVDVQGVIDDAKRAYVLTDPAIHTFNEVKVLPDPCNLGVKGMKCFFHTHTCNAFCKLLGLPERTMSTILNPVACVGQGRVSGAHLEGLTD